VNVVYTSSKRPARASHARAWALVALPLLAASCTDVANLTSPDDSPAFSVSTTAKPAVASITSVENVGPYVIEGPAFDVTVTVTNESKKGLKELSVLMRVVQDGTIRDAGTAPVWCEGGTPGSLPVNSTCSAHIQAAITNNAEGTGTLMAGSATFEAHLVQTSGKKQNTLDVAAEGITLQTLPAGDPQITDLLLNSMELVIEGPGVGYTATIDNPGPPLSDVVVQAYISQGETDKAAGGVVASCPLPNGQVPTGECQHSWAAYASNSFTGPGTLVPGPAELRVELWQSGTRLDSYAVDITLVSDQPPEPDHIYISDFQLGSTQFIIGQNPVPYTYSLTNPIDFFYEGVSVWGTIRQGENYRSAGNDHPVCAGAGGPGNVLPNSTCTDGGSYEAWNGMPGDGDLVPGPAILEIELRVAPHVTYQILNIEITLSW
jgi:hypothetical protein